MGVLRDWEVGQLSRADDHIAMAERHVAKQRLIVARLRADDLVAHDAESLLGTMERTLEAYLEHRQNIVATIARIDAGHP